MLFLPIKSRSISPPGATELQVSIRSTGLCGSDLHYYRHNRNGDIIVQEPLSLGHESAGVVVGVGSDVKNFSIGDKVALEVGQPCETCERCKEGRYNICKSMRFRSSAKSFPHAQGTLQDRINHPAAWCHKYVCKKRRIGYLLTGADCLRICRSTLVRSWSR